MEIYIAPMSGITDFAYRQILKKYKPDLMYTEMVNSNLFTRENEKTLNTIMRMSADENTGVQLFGSDIDELFINFKKLHDLGYTNLLLNMGCPMPKIVKNGSGSGLLDRFSDIELLLQRLQKENIKVSLKIRMSKNTDKYIQLANKYMIPYLCIHLRTKEEKFDDVIHFEELERISKIKRNFKLIANGNIHSLDDYLKIKNLDIDGVMLARGIIGRPYLIEEIRNEKKLNYTLEDVKKLLISHILYIKEDKGAKKASIEINKFLEYYFKDFDYDYTKLLNNISYEEKIKILEVDAF